MLSWRRFSLATATKSKVEFLLWTCARGINVSRLVFTETLCTADVSRSVKKSTNMRTVVLNGLDIKDTRGILAALAFHCKDIRVLEVMTCTLDRSLRDVLDRNKELRELSLLSCDSSPSVDFSGLRCPKIELINLTRTYLGIESVEALMSAGQNITKLTVFFGKNEIWTPPASILLPRLRSLSMHNLSVEPAALYQLVHIMPSVTNLALNSLHMSDLVLSAVFRYCACIRTLSLHSQYEQDANLPTDLSLRVLASYHALSLQVLSIRGCRLLTTTGVMTLVQNCPNLHTLSVPEDDSSQFMLTSAFVECISKHPRLKTLHLCGSYLSEISIQSLTLHGHTLQVLGLNCMCEHEAVTRVLESCESLRTLYLSCTTLFDEDTGHNIGELNLKQLRAAHPHVRIVTGMNVLKMFEFNPLVYPTYIGEVLRT